MLTLSQLQTCIDEAERFIRAARAAKRRIADDSKAAGFVPNEWSNWQTKETAAARRSSLDLMRALADLRRRA